MPPRAVQGGTEQLQRHFCSITPCVGTLAFQDLEIQAKGPLEFGVVAARASQSRSEGQDVSRRRRMRRDGGGTAEPLTGHTDVGIPLQHTMVGVGRAGNQPQSADQSHPRSPWPLQSWCRAAAAGTELPWGQQTVLGDICVVQPPPTTRAPSMHCRQLRVFLSYS